MAAIAELSDIPRTMVWVADDADQCTDFNSSWLVWRGSDLSQDCSSGWRRAICDHDREWMEAMHAHHLGVQRPYVSAFHMTRGDGAERQVIGGAAPWFAPDGRFAGTVGACLDVDDIRRNRHSARAIEAFYRGVLDALNEGTLTPAQTAGGRACIEWSPLVGTSRGAGLLRLARFADTHGLTSRDHDLGAPGSSRFVESLQQRMRRAPRHDGKVAIATFQLQPLCAPSDRLGHSNADDVLSVICGRLVETVRRGDVVGQVDQDTIAILLDGVDDLACAQGVAETLREAACRPVRLAGETFQPQLRMEVQLVTSPADAAFLSASA